VVPVARRFVLGLPHIVRVIQRWRRFRMADDSRRSVRADRAARTRELRGAAALDGDVVRLGSAARGREGALRRRESDGRGGRNVVRAFRLPGVLPKEDGSGGAVLRRQARPRCLRGCHTFFGSIGGVLAGSAFFVLADGAVVEARLRDVRSGGKKAATFEWIAAKGEHVMLEMCADPGLSAPVALPMLFVFVWGPDVVYARVD
jgi:hypothetical protein